MTDRTGHALLDVGFERDRQNAKWGPQHHPDGTSSEHEEQIAAFTARKACELAFASGEGTWRHILDEEVAEAYAESDPRKLREELVQVAAVAVAWIEDIDSRA